ncbi:MAG: NAD(P)H-dependent oxidoreductase [Aquificaceae bacterium]|nr:NAD(P)H-dependent oxidoreductase [Aquificaceae bacterium]MDW8422842.1 NAD(P)H-dependent oxidoreductase [Aquificaceae bacterium]
MVAVIYAHPNPKSFNHAIKEEVLDLLRSKGKPYELRDLYAMGFNPVLSAKDFETFLSGGVPEDIKREQDIVRASELLVFIYPIWWTGMPAILKGYIDRVFSYGFAYEERNGELVGRLSDKRAVVINTLGASALDYGPSGMEECLRKTSDIGIFKFCGIEVVEHIFLYAVPYVSDEERKKMLEQIRSSLEVII